MITHPSIKDLWIDWIYKYPDLEFTLKLIDDIHGHVKHNKDIGGFEKGLFNGNLDLCFAKADSENLPRLEKLLHMKKSEYMEKYWPRHGEER